MDDDVDTLGRWMSHFLAERMDAAEKEADEIAKKRLQQECCTIILDLWERRASLPGRARPLGSLSEILGAIVDLRGKKSPHYSATLRRRKTEGNPWLLFAQEVDTEVMNLVRLSIFHAAAESYLPTEAVKVSKFREFLSEQEIRIVEELQRLIDETGRKVAGSTAQEKTEPDRERRREQVLAAIQARQDAIVQSCGKLTAATKKLQTKRKKGKGA
jgi:hypothetical protein